MGIELDGIVEIQPAKPEATPESRPHFARRLATPVALTLASLSFLMSATLVVGQRKSDASKFHGIGMSLCDQVDDLSDEELNALTRFCMERMIERGQLANIEMIRKELK